MKKLKMLYDESMKIVDGIDKIYRTEQMLTYINDILSLLKNENILVCKRLTSFSHTIVCDWFINDYTGYTLFECDYFKGDLTRFVEDLCMAYYRSVLKKFDCNTYTLIDRIKAV